MTEKKTDETVEAAETVDFPTVEDVVARMRKRGWAAKTENMSDERRASMARHVLGGQLEAEREGEVSTAELLSIGLSAVFGPKPERDVATGRLSAIFGRKATAKANKDESK